jgi:hypothetical protein
VNLQEDQINEEESPDKRLQMYKAMRNELLKEESKSKEAYQKSKMDELDTKI